jgi:hypothetical protein
LSDLQAGALFRFSSVGLQTRLPDRSSLDGMAQKPGAVTVLDAALNAGEIFDDAFIEPDAQSDVAQHPRSQTHIIRIGMPVTYETSNMERLSCYPRHLDSIALPSPVQPEKKFPSLLCTCALQRAHAA